MKIGRQSEHNNFDTANATTGPATYAVGGDNTPSTSEPVDHASEQKAHVTGRESYTVFYDRRFRELQVENPEMANDKNRVD